jgi:hypothetical protein
MCTYIDILYIHIYISICVHPYIYIYIFMYVIIMYASKCIHMFINLYIYTYYITVFVPQASRAAVKPVISEVKKTVVATPLNTTKPATPSQQIKKQKTKKNVRELKKSKIINSQLLASDKGLLTDTTQIDHLDAPEYTDPNLDIFTNNVHVEMSNDNLLNNSTYGCVTVDSDVSTDTVERTEEHVPEERSDITEVNDDSGIYVIFIYVCLYIREVYIYA